MLRSTLLLLGLIVLGDVCEHGGAFGGLEVLGARFLKERLGLRP